jgi:MIP family channel proteins
VIGIALTQGFILTAIVYAIGYISGGHVNPAITITAVALRKLDVEDGVGYVVAQILGAVLAGWVHMFIQPGNGALTRYGAVYPTPAIGGSDFVALIIELIITFFLMFSYYAALYTGKVHAAVSGVLIGLTYAADILIAGPLTGGAANPARALGPAVASGDFSSLWVYWVGPIIGALLAGFVYKNLLTPKRK